MKQTTGVHLNEPRPSNEEQPWNGKVSGVHILLATQCVSCGCRIYIHTLAISWLSAVSFGCVQVQPLTEDVRRCSTLDQSAFVSASSLRSAWHVRALSERGLKHKLEAVITTGDTLSLNKPVSPPLVGKKKQYVHLLHSQGNNVPPASQYEKCNFL